MVSHSPGPQIMLPVSAYADDVSIFVTGQRDIQCLQDTLSLYEKGGSRQCPVCLEVLRGREKKGLKVLGVFLGTETLQAKN